MKFQSARLASLLALAVMPVMATPAKKSGFELTWHAPPACDNRDRVLVAIERLIGNAPSKTTAALLARATITAGNGDGNWRLLLLMETDQGARTRELTARSCAELSAAAVLILALAIDPTLATRQDEPLTAQAPPVRSLASPESTAALQHAAPTLRLREATKPTTATAFPLPKPTLETAVGIGPALVVGVVPAPGIGMTASVSARRGRARLDLAATYTEQRRINLADRADRGGNLGLRTGTLFVCLAALQSVRFELGLCGVLEWGVIVGSGFGVSRPLHVSSPWGASGLGSELRFGLYGPLALGVAGMVAVPWERTDFRLGDRPVFRPSPWVGALRIALVARLF